MKRVLAQHQSAILKLKANINARAMAMSVAFKDDSSQVVSSFHDGTIKVLGELPFLANVGPTAG